MSAHLRFIKIVINTTIPKYIIVYTFLKYLKKAIGMINLLPEQ